MWDLQQVLGNPPEVGLRDHPSGTATIEGGEVDGSRVGTKGPLPAQVDITLEVAHDQFAHAPVDRLAVAEAREVRLRDGAPGAAEPENGEHVVRVLDGFEIEEEGWEAEHAEGRGREDGAFEAVGGAFEEDAAG